MKTREIPRTIHYSLLTIHKPLRGFTLVEILIVVAILGILASVIIPEYTGYTQKAKESAAKESLQLLRSSIERYAIQHNGIAPGYVNGNSESNPSFSFFSMQMRMATNATGEVASIGTQGYPLGPYLSQLPVNPFNGKFLVGIIYNDGQFPENATENLGWIYKPAIKAIRLYWPGTDSEGTRYYDY
jgi:prepilin-type N-terminal cleavage/methylation domain-containing protein